MSSNRGGHVKHAPGHISYAKGNPAKAKKKKDEKSKKIAAGKKRAQELARQEGR